MLRHLTKTVLVALLLALAPAAKAQDFSSFYDTIVDPALGSLRTACRLTMYYDNWDWVCNVYNSLRTIDNFARNFQGEALRLVRTGARNALAGTLEGIGESSIMQYINEFTDRVYHDVDTVFERMPDTLAEDFGEFIHETTYEIAAEAVGAQQRQGADYPVLSLPWMLNQVRTSSAFAPTLNLFETTSIAKSLQRTAQAQKEVAETESVNAKAIEETAQLGRKTLSISGPAGPLDEIDTNDNPSNPVTTNRLSTQSLDESGASSLGPAGRATAAPLYDDGGSAGGGDLGTFIGEPLSTRYKRMADTALSTRDLMHLANTILADVLSGQAYGVTQIATALTNQLQVSVSTNRLLAQQIQLEAEKIRKEEEAAKAEIEAAALQNALDSLNKVTQFSVAAKSLGNLVDATAVEAAVAEFNDCLQNPAACPY